MSDEDTGQCKYWSGEAQITLKAFGAISLPLSCMAMHSLSLLDGSIAATWSRAIADPGMKLLKAQNSIYLHDGHYQMNQKWEKCYCLSSEIPLSTLFGHSIQLFVIVHHFGTLSQYWWRALVDEIKDSSSPSLDSTVTLQRGAGQRIEQARVEGPSDTRWKKNPCRLKTGFDIGQKVFRWDQLRMNCTSTNQ